MYQQKQARLRKAMLWAVGVGVASFVLVQISFALLLPAGTPHPQGFSTVRIEISTPAACGATLLVIIGDFGCIGAFFVFVAAVAMTTTNWRRRRRGDDGGS